jgi:hypothetical protein
MTVPRPALVKKYADFVGKLSNGLLIIVRLRRRVVAIIGGNKIVAVSSFAQKGSSCSRMAGWRPCCV